MSIEERRDSLKKLILKFLTNDEYKGFKEITLYKSILESIDPTNPLLLTF